jgi:hypothetical protein
MFCADELAYAYRFGRHSYSAISVLPVVRVDRPTPRAAVPRKYRGLICPLSNIGPPCGAQSVYVPQVTTSTADWLTAIGTFGAVVVALATPAVAWMLRRRQRPVLSIELAGSEPDLRPVQDASSDAMVAFWVRFTVRNSGRGTAEAVRAQLRRYWVRAAEADDDGVHWAECAIDPQPLSWASRPYHVDPARREAVAIPAGASDLATVALFTVGDAVMTLKLLDSEYAPPSPAARMLVEFRFQVSVGADNADLAVAHLWCERDPSTGLLTGAGRGRKPPPATETRFIVPRAESRPLTAPGDTTRDDDTPAP